MTNETDRGRITWHSSEEDGGPDVGLSIGLGKGALLWIGEVSSSLWESHGGEAMDLGSDGGSWILLYPGGIEQAVIIGRCPADVMHSDLGDLLASYLRAPA